MAGLLVISIVSHVVWLGGAMILLGLSAGVTYFSSIFYSLYGSTAKGKHSGIHEAVLGIGGLFGPLAGGLLAANLGIRAPYALAAVVVMVAIAVEIVLVKMSNQVRIS